jgi:hypothetical protein
MSTSKLETELATVVGALILKARSEEEDFDIACELAGYQLAVMLSELTKGTIYQEELGRMLGKGNYNHEMFLEGIYKLFN